MSKRQQGGGVTRRQAMRAERAKRQRQKRLVTILGISAVALVVAALLIIPNLLGGGGAVEGEFYARPQADMNAMGDPNAPVKIQEYSDFQCPFCKKFSDETEKQIVDNYVSTGKVYFEYIPYGPGGRWIGPESQAAAEAAFCAGDQGKFWEYHDLVFANWKGENVGSFSNSRLAAFSETLGLDMDQFEECLDSNKHDQTLQEGLSAGVAAGIDVTPAFLINGKLVTGAQPYAVFQQEIEAALAAAESQ